MQGAQKVGYAVAPSAKERCAAAFVTLMDTARKRFIESCGSAATWTWLEQVVREAQPSPPVPAAQISHIWFGMYNVSHGPPRGDWGTCVPTRTHMGALP